MQKMKLVAVLAIAALIFSGCNGDHAAHTGKDTAQNSYQVKRDTSRPDSTGADTSSMDNSASGGTKIPKPGTAKKK